MRGISAAAIARARTLAEPRLAPGARKLAWLESFGGRVDLVVAALDGSTPPVVLTGEAPVTPVGAYGGGGFCWASETELVYGASDGRLLAVGADGAGLRVLCRDGRSAAPTVADVRPVATSLHLRINLHP